MTTEEYKKELKRLYELAVNQGMIRLALDILRRLNPDDSTAASGKPRVFSKEELDKIKDDSNQAKTQ